MKAPSAPLSPHIKIVSEALLPTLSLPCMYAVIPDHFMTKCELTDYHACKEGNKVAEVVVTSSRFPSTLRAKQGSHERPFPGWVLLATLCSLYRVSLLHMGYLCFMPFSSMPWDKTESAMGEYCLCSPVNFMVAVNVHLLHNLHLGGPR